VARSEDPAAPPQPGLDLTRVEAMLAARDPARSATVGGYGARDSHDGDIAWRPLLQQSLIYLTVQHTFRSVFEDGTWAETTRGVFWDDYFASVKTVCCWDDHDRWTTNNLFHPLMGSTAAFVFANNHPASQRTPPGNTRQYWSVKGKQLAYATVYSTYFELGPVLSEAAIGNVGLKPGEQTWHDIVVTPTVGIGYSIAEDLLRVHLIDKIDRRSHAWGIASALLLNPTRSVANTFAGKAPWSAPEGLRRRRRSQGSLGQPAVCSDATVAPGAVRRRPVVSQP